MDSRTEYQIRAALEHLMQGRTTLIVAQRLSTVMHADQIIMLEDGRIVEHGTHDELVKVGGRYANLWRLQTDQEAPEEDIRVVPLPECTPEMADMRTMVIVGSSTTRLIARDGTPFVYTPRSVDA